MSDTAAGLTGAYELDPAHTRLGFVARHAMVTNVRGQFKTFTGHLHINEADPSKSNATVTVEMASLTTENDQRDGHLRSGDFFDVDAYPHMTFTSTAAEKVGDDHYRMTGDLTIRDATRPITLDLTFNGSAKDPYGNLRAGFEGTATINRKDFGLSWNAALETGGLLVGDKIKIELDISAIKTA
jgi:polyisoprenoid-binding protein YceI